MWKKVPVLIILAFCSTALGFEKLGTQAQLDQLMQQRSSNGQCISLFAQNTSANQFKFAHEFLGYDEKDMKQGLVAALSAYFVGTSVLFNFDPVPQDQVNKDSISYQKRKHGFREADRTITSIILLQRLILGKPLKDFATPIPPLDPNEGDIARIRQVLFDFLTGEESVSIDSQVFAKVQIARLHAIIANLIYHDQGKIPQVISEYKIRMAEQGVAENSVSADHDVILSDILNRFPEEMAFDILNVMPEPAAIMNEAKVGAMNPGRLFQTEAPASHLKGVASIKSMDVFRFWWLKEVLDVGGVRAVSDPGRSFWIRPVISNYFKLWDDFPTQLMGNPENAIAYYDKMLVDYGAQMGLTANTKDEKAFVRLARLLRINQFPENYEGIEGLNPQGRRIEGLKKAFKLISQNERDIIIEELNKNGIDDGWAFTLGYIPEFMENGQNFHGIWIAKGDDETPAHQVEKMIRPELISDTYTLALKAFARILSASRSQVGNYIDKQAAHGEFTLELAPIKGDPLTSGFGPLLDPSLTFKLEPAGGFSAEVVIESQQK